MDDYEYFQISLNDCLREVVYFLQRVISSFYLNYTDVLGETRTINFPALFISLMLLHKIFDVFFGKYNAYDHNDMDTDDLYDE